jgi:hypothetical protein
MIWLLLLGLAASGAIGGAINAIISDNGFILPKTTQGTDGKILRPGFLGNLLLGAVGAVVSWGLYGPFAALAILGNVPKSQTVEVYVTLAGFVGAALVGAAGARWWTNEIDKKLLQAAASKAAAKPGTDRIAEQIRFASPAEALQLASAM